MRVVTKEPSDPLLCLMPCWKKYIESCRGKITGTGSTAGSSGSSGSGKSGCAHQ
jgi:hypothetical protein